MRPWQIAHGLEAAGVLGMNGRNGDYILPCNPRKLYPLVDDKLLTKELAQRVGLATPELYATFRYSNEIRHARELLDKYENFVASSSSRAGWATTCGSPAIA